MFTADVLCVYICVRACVSMQLFVSVRQNKEEKTLKKVSRSFFPCLCAPLISLCCQPSFATDCRVGLSPWAHSPSHTALVLDIKWPVNPPRSARVSAASFQRPAALVPQLVPAPRHRTSACLSKRGTLTGLSVHLSADHIVLSRHLQIIIPAKTTRWCRWLDVDACLWVWGCLRGWVASVDFRWCFCIS